MYCVNFPVDDKVWVLMFRVGANEDPDKPCPNQCASVWVYTEQISPRELVTARDINGAHMWPMEGAYQQTLHDITYIISSQLEQAHTHPGAAVSIRKPVSGSAEVMTDGRSMCTWMTVIMSDSTFPKL